MTADRLSHRHAFRQAQVTDTIGVMSDVSLIQSGEAKGHGVFVDAEALKSALRVAPDKIPAFLTHEGALEADRILQQVGFFKGFYIDEDRLMAREFVALDSFKKDEPERYNRLFDIASEIPETFGISLVFENELFWILEDGSQVKFEDQEKPAKAKYDMPVVRFVEIYSADFVDEPACNDKGLFKALTKYNSKTDMEDTLNLAEEETEEKSEEEVPTVEETALSSEELAEEEETPEEEVEESADTEETKEDAALDLMTELAQGVADLSKKVDSLVATQASQGKELEKLTVLNNLGLAKKVAPKSNQVSEETLSVKERYMAMNGSELIKFTRKNKGELNKALKVRR